MTGRGSSRHRGRIVSFAQNGEDVILRRALNGSDPDVGAANPVENSPLPGTGATGGRSEPDTATGGHVPSHRSADHHSG